MWTLDQANVFEGNDSGVGDNPANFTTVAAIAAGAHLFLLIHSDLLPTGITVGGTAMQKDKDVAVGSDFLSRWSAYLPSGKASSSTIAVTFSVPPNFCACLASSFLGGATTDYLDQVNSQSGGSGEENIWFTSSITPTVGNTLVIGAKISTTDTDSRSTADANWPETHDVREFANMVMIYRIVTDMSAYNPTGSWVTSQPPGYNQAGITVNYKSESTVTLVAVRPDADIATTGWATAPLYSKVNDSSDATVITATAS